MKQNVYGYSHVWVWGSCVEAHAGHSLGRGYGAAPILGVVVGVGGSGVRQVEFLLLLITLLGLHLLCSGQLHVLPVPQQGLSREGRLEVWEQGIIVIRTDLITSKCNYTQI